MCVSVSFSLSLVHSSINSVNTYLLSSYYLAGPVPGVRDLWLTKTHNRSLWYSGRAQTKANTNNYLVWFVWWKRSSGTVAGRVHLGLGVLIPLSPRPRWTCSLGSPQLTLGMLDASAPGFWALEAAPLVLLCVRAPSLALLGLTRPPSHCLSLWHLVTRPETKMPMAPAPHSGGFASLVGIVPASGTGRSHA